MDLSIVKRAEIKKTCLPSFVMTGPNRLSDLKNSLAENLKFAIVNTLE